MLIQFKSTLVSKNAYVGKSDGVEHLYLYVSDGSSQPVQVKVDDAKVAAYKDLPTMVQYVFSADLRFFKKDGKESSFMSVTEIHK